MQASLQKYLDAIAGQNAARRSQSGGQGSLTIVGTGIKAVSQMTREAEEVIASRDVVHYLVCDTTVEQWIHHLNPNSRTLVDCYEAGTNRYRSYERIVERLVGSARQGRSVCGAFYGHPGVFVHPAHEAVRLAKREGIWAAMQPGISAEACLYAELGVNPAEQGCSQFEATDFLIHERRFDLRSVLILWQVGVIGNSNFEPEGYDTSGIAVLLERLLIDYPASHRVAIYEASFSATDRPSIEWLQLQDLRRASLTYLSTLYIPALPSGSPSAAMLSRLRMTETE